MWRDMHTSHSNANEVSRMTGVGNKSGQKGSVEQNLSLHSITQASPRVIFAFFLFRPKPLTNVRDC